jgi:hypothetical protein
MPKKSRRSVSRKVKKTRKHKHHRRSTRRRGGANLGAPLDHHLSGSWPSRMSLGQGADYFKYHEGQHGGVHSAPFPSAVVGSTLPSELRGPAHLGGIDNALSEIKGMCDPPNCPGTTTGGRRKKRHTKRHTKRHSKRHAKKHGKKHTKKHRRTHHKRRRGGAIGYAPFPSAGMLLDSSKAYAQAGLNPEWKTDVAFADAKIRDTQ